MFGELQYGLPHGYVVIDLGSEKSPRWLNSRLYLLAFLMTWLDHVPPIVFLETTGGVRRRFVGVATPERIRWALAMYYPWLESAMAKAYAEMDQAPRPQFPRGTQDPQSSLQFDPGSRSLTAVQAQGVIDRFLFEIQRSPLPPPLPPPLPSPPPPGVQSDAAPGWVVFKDGTEEFARWLRAERVERLLGPDLSRAAVVLEHNQVLGDMGPAVLKQEARFVGVLTTERVFQALLDREAALEQVALQYVRRAGSNQGRETAE